MTSTDVDTHGEAKSTLHQVDQHLEVVVIPVTDVDHSKAFYASLGWRLDADFSFDSGFRVVQFTPPGSGASVQFGTNISTAAPGSAQGLYLVVSDIESAREELAGRVDENATSYAASADLANAMRRASEAHGRHEARIGQADANWPDWYAA